MRVVRPSPAKGSLSRKQVRTVVRATHVVPDSEGWKVMPPAGRNRPKRFRQEGDALKFAAQASGLGNGIVFIHEKGGKVRKATARSLVGSR